MAGKTKAASGSAEDRPSASRSTTSTFISADAIYPLDEFLARTGLTGAAMRAARRRGLRVLRTGKRAFVSGQDFLEFLVSETEVES